MKNRLVVSVVALMLLTGLSLVWAVSMILKYRSYTSSQEPDPLNRETVMVKFKIENQGSQGAQDTIVKLSLKYPLPFMGIT